MERRCARCGDGLAPDAPEEADLCARCRREVIRGASRRAWIVAAVVAAGYAWLMWWSGLVGSPALMFFVALGAVLAFVAYKVARRVFFDVLRGRATGDDTR
jgi:hypothetical protein